MTTEELSRLENEELNRRVAEASGWARHLMDDGSPMTPPRWIEPGGAMSHGILPTYATSLDAMHQALTAMPDERLEEYGEHLLDACGVEAGNHDFLTATRVIFRATARQRAIAFMLTMEGGN